MQVILFNMDIGSVPMPPGTQGAGGATPDAEHEKLEGMVRELSTALTSVKHEQVGQ